MATTPTKALVIGLNQNCNLLQNSYDTMRLYLNLITWRNPTLLRVSLRDLNCKQRFLYWR